MNSLRATHVHRTLPVVAVDVVRFESLNEGRQGGFKPNRRERVVFDNLFILDSQELVCDCQVFGTEY
jgi:hypothetical protein